MIARFPLPILIGAGLVQLCAGRAEAQAQLPAPGVRGTAVAPSASPAPEVAVKIAAGERVARQACASCHLFPEPDVADRKTWKEQILPRMETRMGVSPPDYGSSPEGPLLKRLHIYPEQPLVSPGDWEAIVDYYLARAPVTAPPQDPRPEIQVGLPRFEVIPARFRHAPPLTTLLKVSPANQGVYLGDDRARSLTLLDTTGKVRDVVRLDNVPISLVEVPGGIYLTAIGSFQPSELQQGGLFFIVRENGKLGIPKVILKDLPRAAHTEFGDFNGDGRMDFAMCLFGNQRGRFSWFENRGADEYRERILVEKAGAIHCLARDFDGDSIPDLALLMAQEAESFQIFANDGKGNFSPQLIFQKHPAFGHNYFELADFDQDGRLDLLVVNGDNGEYESPLKKYHGVRIYRNHGTNRYEEAMFFPLNGATKAIARDFDDDGDLDIAAISFFPDYVKSPRESFVYLENRGQLTFSPSTFAQCISGRWIAMDAGDVDGDGDLDICLGSYIRGPTAVPGFLSQSWEKQGPSVILLRNKLR